MASEHYSVSQRFFHWVIALLVIGNLAGGLTADALGEESRLAEQIMGLHMATGLLIFFLVLARLGTRLVSKVPSPLASWPEWTRKLSVIGHWALYAMILVMPISGYMMVSGHGNVVDFYGLFEFPNLLGKSETIEGIGHEVHEILAWILIVTVLGHAGFALKHHFIDKDETLRRMTRGS